MLHRLKIGTKIGAAFALGLLMLTLMGLICYLSTNELISTSRKENHTYLVLSKIEDLNSKLQSAETGQRGYIITGENIYLQPYESALPVLKQRISELRNLTLDNPNQQKRLDALEPLLTSRVGVLEEGINLRQNQGFTAARDFLITGQGLRLMNNIRRITSEMVALERQLLEKRSQRAQLAATATINAIIYGVPISIVILAVLGFLLTRSISKPLGEVAKVAARLGEGDFSLTLPTTNQQDEIGLLTRTFNQMIVNLRENIQQRDDQNWLQSNLAEFTQKLQGQRDLQTVASLALSYLAPLVGAAQGVFYVQDFLENEPLLKLLGSYAYKERKNLANQFRLGEGLVGQCALEKQRILLTQVPSDYIRINSGLGEALPLNIVVVPTIFEKEVIGVIELASFQQFRNLHLTFLEQVSETIAVIIKTIASDLRTQDLLKQSQDLTIELQQQQAELQQTNQFLEEQTQALQESELVLRKQQEQLKFSNDKLQQLNEELEEKAELLEAQKQEVERKNQEIEQARQALEEKAEQLALSSKYKSEFLANMSHELRTPLNSLLILARLLSENPDANLTTKQVEYSRTIYSAGTDLLELINDILDLAKIESGTLSVEIEQLNFIELKNYFERNFNQIAENKGLSFKVELSETLPPKVSTDAKLLQQIMRNLLSNAFKFTERGGVTLQIGIAEGDMIAFAVEDTGIGIPLDKQKIIFEAFQQADGSTSRKYGGTGLGLSISRELAQLLGGRIELQSIPQQGSTFTLYLPQSTGRQNIENKIALSPSPPPTLLSSHNIPIPQSEILDDREIIQEGDHILLIIEDDEKFARILLEMARQKGFKTIVALRAVQGLELAQKFKPDAITLDIYMPEMDGWTVLDRLKRNPNTRHIPVHIMSVDDRQQRGLQLGAIAYLQKPVSKEALIQTLDDIKAFIERKVKNLLLIEDDPLQVRTIIELIGSEDVQITAVHTGDEALSFLQFNRVDCIVLDLGLPDMTGFELIEQIKENLNFVKIPIIVYTGKELSRQEETELRKLAETIIIKDVRSPERLLDETSLFLHQVQANLPQTKQQMLDKLYSSDPVLANKKILIVDDDMRNIFALTSLLEGYQMEVMFAEDGRSGIEMLQANPDIDIVLMDIMMPEMDGYETTRIIRQEEQFRSLTIIALTAKAMQGDREKCIEAGASDYITKPVDTEQLISLLRVWLYQ